MTSMSGDLWLGRVRWIAYGLLALATVAATLTASSLGDLAGDVRVMLAVAAVTALWMLATPFPGVVHWVGRTVLAFVLCLLSPL